MTLILDNDKNENIPILWSIYYHLYLNTDEQIFLCGQAKKLFGLSVSQKEWESGPYAKTLRFYDDSSRVAVREVWSSYFGDQSGDNNDAMRRKFQGHIDKSMAIAKQLLGENHVGLLGIRSAAPAGFNVVENIDKIHRHFWKHGVLTWNIQALKTSCHPNPTIASGLTAGTLHYAVNPIAGFHLARVHIHYTEDKHNPKLESEHPLQRIVDIARFQFRSWAEAFNLRAERTIVRFLVNDAFVACDMLQDQGNSDPASKFNVIDTSNLIDHLGSLNLLIAVTPLLDNSHQSILHTDLLVKTDADAGSSISGLLHGDFTTMALLLGLCPVAYWANASMAAPEEEIFNKVSSQSRKLDEQHIHTGQAYSRLSWKRSLTVKVDDRDVTPYIASDSLAQLFHRIYLEMFASEDMNRIFELGTSINSVPTKTMLLPVYHRGSFVKFLSYIKAHINSNWDEAISETVRLIENDLNLSTGRNFIQELFTQLHLQGLYSTNSILQPTSICESNPIRKSLHRYSNLPSIVCITLKAPRSKLKVFTDLSSQPMKLGTPFVNCSIESSTSIDCCSWGNRFGAVQLCFGNISASSSSSGSLKTSSHVDVDEKGWNGQAPLLLSFLVPSWMLLQDPQNTSVALVLNGTLKTVKTYIPQIGPSLVVYRTKLENESNVYITESEPSLSCLRPECVIGILTRREQHMSHTHTSPSSVTLGLDNHSKLVSITSRLDLKPGSALDALRSGSNVVMEQQGPLCLLISIKDESAKFTYPTHFPIPITISKTTLRVARKSAYIELFVRVDASQIPAHQQDELLSLPHAEETPMLYSAPRLSIDLYPTIDSCKNLAWLETHVSIQMSHAERRLREAYLTTKRPSSSARVNFKDSLFSLFMHFSDLQGQRAKAFGLTMPALGGVHILPFVSKLKLDVGNHTVFLDAAVLSLTPTKLEKLEAFLSNLASQDLCQIIVDPNEL